jgi:predicted dehydrogenase
LPALAALEAEQIDVASVTRANTVAAPPGMSIRLFETYETALAHSDAELVYISTRNHSHAAWAEQALRRGFHVIVDKPAFTNWDDTQRLVALAQQSNRCLAEATVYAYHPQIQAAHDAFARAGSQPTRLMATFSFPPLPVDNFRYLKACDGGALWDLGPYAVTPGRLFFGDEPQEVSCHINTWSDEVETSFSLLAAYSDGRSMIGHFGFDTGYRNRLDILGPELAVTIDRVFSTSAEIDTTLEMHQGQQSYHVKVPAADHVVQFLQHVFGAIKTGEHHLLAQQLLADASMLHRLRQSALRSSGFETIYP